MDGHILSAIIDCAILVNHINREIHIAIIVIVSARVPAEVDAHANFTVYFLKTARLSTPKLNN